MRNIRTGQFVNWLLAICGLFVFYNIDSMWTLSVDLAHHYALAFRISEEWVLTTTKDPALVEMIDYPRGSHILAAIVGLLVNSTFFGLQITTLFSLALLWLCALLIINSLQTKIAAISLINFTILVAFNSITTQFDIHGQEIVGNYFYSQLVGHALLFISIIIAINMEKTRGELWSVFALVVMLIINLTIHLLPTFEIFGLICGLLFFYVVLHAESRDIIRRRLLVSIPIIMFILFFIVLHPTFSIMSEISKNNGGISLHNIQYPYGLVLLCILVVFSSFTLIYGWTRSPDSHNNIAVKYLAIYGFVSAALCLLQFTLTFFGHGSDYAVKKYSFGLMTVFFLELSTISGIFICKLIEGKDKHFLNSVNYFSKYILAGSLTVTLILSVSNQKSLDVSDVVSIERKLIVLNDTILPPPGTKNNVAIGLESFPNTINYMFSISILKTIRQTAIQDILINDKLSDLTKYSYIVSSYNNPRYGANSCETLSDGSLSIVTAECINERQHNLTGDGRNIFNFTGSGNITNNLLEEFGGPEDHGRWTDGDSAKITCINNDMPIKK